MFDHADEIRESFAAEAASIPPDAVARVSLSAPQVRRRMSAGTRFMRGAAAGVVAVSITAVVLSALSDSPTADGRGRAADSAIDPPAGPGEGAPCVGAREIRIDDLVKLGRRDIYVPGGLTLNDAQIIWSCGELSEVSPVALQFEGNLVVSSGPVDRSSELTSEERASNYKAYVASLKDQEMQARDGSEATVAVVQGEPALIVPKFDLSLMSLVEYELEGTEIRVTNDGSLSMEQLTKIAESLTPALTSTG